MFIYYYFIILNFLFQIKKKRKVKKNKYKNNKCFKFVLKSTFNFILRSNHSLHLGPWFYQALLRTKLIWFNVFYLHICIYRKFLKLRLDYYVSIAKYTNNSKWFCSTQFWIDLFLNMKNKLKCLSEKYQNQIL